MTPEQATKTIQEALDAYENGNAEAREILRPQLRRVARLVERAELEALPKKILAILDRRRTSESSCTCATCRVVAESTFSCELCGYLGHPVVLSCCCYEDACRPGRGKGCPHGHTVCPACDDGGGSDEPWSTVREVREAVKEVTTW